MSAATRKMFLVLTCEMVSKLFQMIPAAIPLTMVKPGMSATAESFPMYANDPLWT